MKPLSEAGFDFTKKRCVHTVVLYERKRIVSRDPLKYISRKGGRKLDIAGISFVTGAGESIFSEELAVAKKLSKTLSAILVFILFQNTFSTVLSPQLFNRKYYIRLPLA